MAKEKVVLAYSGGLDTSIIIPWLKEHYDLDVIACCVDVGQDDDMETVEVKAIESGASKVYVEDKKEEFVRDYAFRALRAGAVYENKYLLGTSVARPLISKTLVDVAHKEGAAYICHGCTGKGNDQVRFETGVFSLDPTLKIIAPWRVWHIKSREDALAYAAAHDIPIAHQSTDKPYPYSMDWNIWHLSHEGADLEDPANEPQNDVYLVTTPPEKAPDTPEYVSIDFEKGVPVAVNSEKQGAVQLLTTLNEIGARNGIGIVDIVENRLVGMKSRGVYENPGGALIMYAHKELEYLCLDRATMHCKEELSGKYADLVYDGMWFSPLREALAAFVDVTQETVTGTVTLKLYKGNIISAGSVSPYSLYSEEFVTFGEDDVYNQQDAEGFINLFGLPLKMRALMLQAKKK